MEDTLCLDPVATEALVSTLGPHDTRCRPESEYLAYISLAGARPGPQLTGTPTNHALDCTFYSPT
jgi:hypothetical protein